MDRKRIAEIRFQDEEKLKRPECDRSVRTVKRYIQKSHCSRRKKRGTEYVFVEAALLIEEKYDEICDELWYVYVEDSIRRKRLKYARGYEDSKVDQIFEAQLPKDLFMRHCDRVIDNSGQFEETKIQLNKIVEDL